jgi:hypothetical protein
MPVTCPHCAALCFRARADARLTLAAFPVSCSSSSLGSATPCSSPAGTPCWMAPEVLAQARTRGGGA